MAIALHNKWMKELFSKLQVHSLKEHILWQVICQSQKLQNYSLQCRSCAFFRKIEENLFWVIETIKEASPTNSIMILSHTLYVVITDVNALYFMLYSFGNIQIKSGPPPVSSLSYIKLAKNLSIQRVNQNSKMKFMQ